MKGRIRKHIKEIERLAGVRIASVAHTGSTHLRLLIVGLQQVVVCSATPSDRNSRKVVARDIKRLLKGT